MKQEINKERITSLLHQLELDVVNSVSTEEKIIALTFDCCYCPGKFRVLSKVLCLWLLQIRCTFFVTGKFCNSFPQGVSMLKRLGFEVMNHSLTHPNFRMLDKMQQEKEIIENALMIEKLTGEGPALFRFPYGITDPRVIRLLKAHRMRAIQWSVNTIDWREDTDPEKIYEAIKNAGPGSIILCHIFGKGFMSVIRAVQELKRSGYRFIPVSELLKFDQ